MADLVDLRRREPKLEALVATFEAIAGAPEPPAIAALVDQLLGAAVELALVTIEGLCLTDELDDRVTELETRHGALSYQVDQLPKPSHVSAAQIIREITDYLRANDENMEADAVERALIALGRR